MKSLNLTNNQICGLYNDRVCDYDGKWRDVIKGRYTSAAIDKLCDVLPQTNLSSLNLQGNTLGDEGSTKLAGVLPSTSITELNVDGYTLPIAELRGIKPVEAIDLSHEKLSISSGIIIASSIKDNTQLKSLNLAGNDLANDGKDMSGVLKLAEVLPSTSITSLNLGHNNLTNYGKDMSGVLKLAEVLPSTSIASLNVDGHPLPIDELCGIKPVEAIDLSNMSLGYSSSIIIASCIKDNKQMKSLNLRGNHVRAEGGTKLAEVLPSTSITNLNLARNQLCANMPNLTSVNLAENNLTISGKMSAVLKLAEVLPSTSITSLNLSGNRIDGGAATRIKKAAPRMMKIEF